MSKIIKLNSNNYVVLHLSDESVRPLILIAPGGGYQRTSEREAMPIVNQFKDQYHTAIIYYRETLFQEKEAIEEQVAFYEKLSEEQLVSQIILMGFSSGGHYSARLGLNYHKYNLKKPLAMVLLYPVISGIQGIAHEDSIMRLYGIKNDETRALFSLENQVTIFAPKTFLFHTVDDDVVPYENSLFLFQALKKNNIDVDLHLYHSGLHGISLGTKEVAFDHMNQDDYDKANRHNQTWVLLVKSFLNQINR